MLGMEEGATLLMSFARMQVSYTVVNFDLFAEYLRKKKERRTAMTVALQGLLAATASSFLKM